MREGRGGLVDRINDNELFTCVSSEMMISMLVIHNPQTHDEYSLNNYLLSITIDCVNITLCIIKSIHRLN